MITYFIIQFTKFPEKANFKNTEDQCLPWKGVDVGSFPGGANIIKLDLL